MYYLIIKGGGQDFACGLEHASELVREDPMAVDKVNEMPGEMANERCGICYKPIGPEIDVDL